MDYELVSGAKMMYLIKRKLGTAREELVAHWFSNHMTDVIDMQARGKQKGGLAAHKYIATLFQPTRDGEHIWDGMAQLWYPKPLPEHKGPKHGTNPSDMFQVKAEPYEAWATKEYQVLDGRQILTSEPNAKNSAYPMTRSGFFKVTFFVKSKANTDYTAFMKHWLEIHVPNVKETMLQVDGFRYVVSHSIEPRTENYAGMAELYFHNKSGWDEYRRVIKADGMEEWVDGQKLLILHSEMEMVGIP